MRSDSEGSDFASSSDGPPTKDVPLRTVQPVVVPGQLYTCGTVASGFLAIFPAFFAGMIGGAITKQSGPSIGFGLVAYVVFFALIMALFGWKAYSGPGVTFYRIYRDRIEVEEGLLTRKQRTVLIGGIFDVTLTEGMLQRTQGAGTITLLLQPLLSQGENTVAHQSITLTNVPDPRNVYDLIRSLALDQKGAEDRSRG